jgi:iron complex transport system substrate-binding protein
LSRALLGLAALIAATMSAAGATDAISVRDDRGETLTLAQPVRRIVALAPHLAELAYAAGAGDKLVGVSAYSDYPAQAGALPVVGDAANLDLERIVALKPDLLLAWKSGNGPLAIERLARLGLPVFVSEVSRLDEIAGALRRIGALSGSKHEAERVAGALERSLGETRARFKSAAKVRAFIEVWHDPLITVNGDHMMSDIVSICGGENVFARAPLLTPSVGMEDVMKADPDAVIGGSSWMRQADFLAAWRGFPGLRAVARKQIFFVHPDLLQRATPRALLGVERVCEVLESSRRAIR